ncbi:type ISP restriction/modification enzyme [Haliea sp. E1-2-M8]|uniref:type ISP restriction/modification enzyme n=1 Tax=Haliea sp. E1-2-M8 TaxID=3064706 RepID=UPI0027168E01|nr:type ISP restriction/modification enzyme [Haliea sp. E1-2-M8]MDO8862913.1 type ISP restriction/modification enzyme [Haliea sp. E1-2-M8]
MSVIKEFLDQVIKTYKTGSATEHSYRPAFVDLFYGIDEGITALNEPKRIKCGAPDFIITQGEIAIGHVEAKDLHIGIRAMKDSNKDQQHRYKAALPNLIYTNGLDWDFYRDGELTASVAIADFLMGVIPKPDQYETLENLLRDFIAQKPQTITSPRDLAERMAGKANLIKDVLRKTLADDEALQTELMAQYQAFKENLIHDITPEDFADIYAETIAYGMFAARLHDTTLDTFSRQEAMELLPKSNPFLRSLFSYVAGYDLDDRIAWIIDDLARVFQACDVAQLMEGFGKLTGQNDPFLHFYETFLAAYNPAKRKARGVWYTPEPVVNFIVRAVDEVLQTEFGLPDGLADTSKVTVDWDTGQTDKKGKAVTIKKDVHRVQILDPATGTGTFLAEVIKQIAPKIQGVAPGMWSSYIEADLIPRLHGFELLMASYAMCHMKLDMILTEMGYTPTGSPPRLSVYLTNSLEEGEPANQQLPFSQWLSREAKGANAIKRDMPIMCVLGNPPYSGISHNMGGWITDLIDDYKYVDGVHFGERKHWLHDDYVKFIRLSESLIEKNGEGVLGFITNHGYLDNPTFRGMRWHLLNTFDRIHVLDLHGNAKKKEVTPDGKPDKNVFDIQQGVAIIIGVKTGAKKKGLAEVYHGDLWGSRDAKYTALTHSRLGKPVTKRIDCAGPQYAFAQRDHALTEVYGKGFGLADFIPVNGTGIVTAKDGLVIDFTKQGLRDRISRFADPVKTDDEVRAEFFPSKKAGKYPPGDSRGWKLPAARASIQSADWVADIKPIAYRLFDTRAILYRPDMVDWGRFDTMHNMLAGKNFALISCRQSAVPTWEHIFIAETIVDDSFVSNRTKERGYCLPLYLYPNEQELDQNRRVNFDDKLYSRLQGLASHPDHGTPDEIAVFDYIYGVLHCLAYRETYAEFLKIDFPRIPWPVTPDEFWNVSAKGTELRKLHLMDPAVIGQTPYPFTGEGDNLVVKPRFEEGRVWINEAQYFDSVPEVSWCFYIGGYQPAQKWLKDRKGRALAFDDVKHYQRILKILAETDRVMRTIDMTLDAS